MRPFKADWREAVAASTTLTPTQRLVAWRLADYANRDGTNAWPSHDRLARDCGLKDRSSVQRAIKALIHAGFLMLARKANPMLGLKTNSYSLVIPERRGATASSLALVNGGTEAAESDEALVPPGTVPGAPRRGATARATRRHSRDEEALEPQDQSLDQSTDHFVSYGHDRERVGDTPKPAAFKAWTCSCRAVNDGEECRACGAFWADFPASAELSPA